MSEQYGTVVRVEALAPHMRRIVFGGAGLADFTPTGFTDQYVKALFPPPGAPYEVPFDPEAVKVDHAEHPPRGRRETIRSWDPVAREVTIDFVLHGDVGFAGRWAEGAAPGDRLQMSGPSGGYAPRGDAPWHLLVGDESALPAIGAALDSLASAGSATPTIVVAIVDGPDHEIALPAPPGLTVTWVHRCDHADDPDALLRAVESLDFPPGDPHLFVHGEAGEVRSIRRHLLGDRAIAADGQSISPYWRREHTDEQWRRIKRQWLADSEGDVPVRR